MSLDAARLALLLQVDGHAFLLLIPQCLLHNLSYRSQHIPQLLVKRSFSNRLQTGGGQRTYSSSVYLLNLGQGLSHNKYLLKNFSCMNQLNKLPSKPSGSKNHREKKTGIHSKHRGKVNRNLPLRHCSEFMFHSSHSKPHYIQLNANVPANSEFVFL